MLSLRAFKRALTAPYLFPIEIIVALTTMDNMRDSEQFWKVWVHKYNILGMLVFSHFLIHRCRVLVNKLTYLLVSFLTAFKNKKQHIRNTWVCVLL